MNVILITLPRTFYHNSGLPDLALLLGVHPGAEGAVEVLRELPAVAEGALDPEEAGGVCARLDLLLQRLVPELGAPRVGSRDPKHLTK